LHSTEDRGMKEEITYVMVVYIERCHISPYGGKEALYCAECSWPVPARPFRKGGLEAR
jgi:hypothetical protein